MALGWRHRPGRLPRAHGPDRPRHPPGLRKRRSAESGPHREDRITGLHYDPADPQFLDDPFAYYRWLRDAEPVHLHEASGSYFLSRFEDVWNATQDWQTFSSESPVTSLLHMASMDPPLHDRLRASVARGFGPRRIAALESTVRGVCRDLLRPLRGAGRVDLAADFAAIFPSRVIHRVMGVPAPLEEPFRRCALAIATAADSEQMAVLMAELVDLSHRVVAGDPPPEQPGLIQELQAGAGAGELSHRELMGVCSNLVLAGTDTVTNLIGNGLVLLHRHPEARRRLARGEVAVAVGVEEMLRLESPVQSLGRRATRSLSLHGREIPAGSEVRLLWGAANRDDREFERPDAFEIDRVIRRHLAFGHAIHFCIGARLARLEARVAFEEILRAWPEYHIDEGALVRVPSFWARGWEHVAIEAA